MTCTERVNVFERYKLKVSIVGLFPILAFGFCLLYHFFYERTQFSSFCDQSNDILTYVVARITDAFQCQAQTVPLSPFSHRTRANEVLYLD